MANKEKYNLTGVKKDLKYLINYKGDDDIFTLKMLRNFIKCYIAYSRKFSKQKQTKAELDKLQFMFMNGVLDTNILIEQIIHITHTTVYTILDKNGNNIKRYIL